MANLGRYAEGYVEIGDNGVVVKWEKLTALNKFSDRTNNILWLLLDLGILSSDYRGNWSVDFGPHNYNPRITSSPGRMKLYFTDRANAREYARYAFPNGGCEIYRL